MPIPPVFASTVAIAYDFDDTLARKDMFSYAIPVLRVDTDALRADMQRILDESRGTALLAVLYLLADHAKKAGTPITRALLAAIGEQMEPFPGLPEYFPRLNQYAAERGITLEHYIISSNLREILEGTPVAPYFKRIFGSAYIYDANGEACWPSVCLDYTGKTQFLYRISKGCLEEHDSRGVNAQMHPAERPIPFSGIVFVGDGYTDIPAMALTRQKGGHSFAVYDPEEKNRERIARELEAQGRVNAALPADYREGSALDCALKAVIDSVAANLP